MKRTLTRTAALICGVLGLTTVMAAPSGVITAERGSSIDGKRVELWPQGVYRAPVDATLEARVDALLEQMSLEQKVAQIIQPEIRDFSVEDMRRFGFGSFLNGGGSFPGNNSQATAADWVKLADAMYQAAMDTEHLHLRIQHLKR